MQTDELVKRALEAQRRSYSPYSSFAVGAALLAQNGDIFSGCNVENVSFGLTICAERACVVSAVSAGRRDFEAILLVADTPDPIVPCGACRQFLAEFNPELMVFSRRRDGEVFEYRLSDLLPKPRQGILET